MRKYKVEDLYVATITDEESEDLSFSIGKYSGRKKCFIFDTEERIKIYSKYPIYNIDDNERVVKKLIPLSFCLKDKDIKAVQIDDILYMQQQLYNWRNYHANSLEILEGKKVESKTGNKIVSNEFLLELKKVMDKIDPNMNEELKKEYQTKLSNIGNEYINSVVENYSSIKLNPSLELEILKEYLKKLGALEEEIVKLNYRSNLENELEQIKKYEMKKDNN